MTPPPASTAGSVSVRGRVETLFFSSPAFSAGRLLTGAGETVSFAGSLMVASTTRSSSTAPGSSTRSSVAQLKVAGFEFDQRLGPEGLAHYLANHPDIKGIGPVKAKRIAEAFGHDFDSSDRGGAREDRRGGEALARAVHALRTEWLRTRR